MGKEIRDGFQPITRLFVYTPELWTKIADAVARIDLCAFGEGSSFEQVKENFSHPNFRDASLLTVLLCDETGLVIGYSQAEQSWTKVSARIVRTALVYEYQGKGLVGDLMNRMEMELKTKGVETLTRKARIKNGYAEAIRRHYGNRVIGDYTDGIRSDTERCFVIKI
jgi:hypothetical protein